MLFFQSLGKCLIVLTIVVSSVTVAWSAESDQKLFINLSTDQIDRAALAISFGTQILDKKEIPVSIFLNVEGVRIADRNIPEHKHSTGKSLKELLNNFMAQGGQVIVCPMCMKNVGGLGEADLIDGVKMGGPDVT